jgi:oxygen-dependent protoporphyrinogen oxidase
VRYALFVAPAAGMGSFVEALESKMPPGSIHRGSKATQVLFLPGSKSWRVTASDGSLLECDAVCLAVPAWEASRLLTKSCGALSEALRSVPYASTAVLNLAFRQEDVPHPLNGFGVVVPAQEKKSVMAVSFSSVKFAGRAPAGKVLLRLFVGGALRPELMEMDDTLLEHAVLRDLRELLGVRAVPQKMRVARHPASMPQYEMGHLERVGRIEGEVKLLHGLALAGNAYRGVGIPDCVRSGELAAEAVVRTLDPDLGDGT